MKQNAETVKLLRRYMNARKNYMTAKRELEEIETMISGLSIDYSKQKVQSTPEADKLADIVDKLHTLRTKCSVTLEKAVYEMENTKMIVDSIEDATLHEVLSRRYINCQKWENIASEMNYSWEGIHKLHRRAVEEVKKVTE